MDTTKITTQIDSVVVDSLGRQISQHITIETATQDKCDSCVLNLCDCKLLSDWAYPLFFLLLILCYRKSIRKLIDIIITKIEKSELKQVSGLGLVFQMSNDEKKEELRKEINSTIEQTNNDNTIDREEIINRYSNIEKDFTDRIRLFLTEKYLVKTDYRIRDSYFDIILEATTGSDVIIELKYFVNGISVHLIQNAIQQLFSAQNNYETTLKRIAKPILIVVLPNEKYDQQKVSDISNKYSDITIGFIKQDEVNNLSEASIKYLLRL